jgi:hypothetical protein
MMRVKMLTNIAGTPSYHSGDIVELEDRIAQAWVKEGMATLVRDAKPVEQATK